MASRLKNVHQGLPSPAAAARVGLVKGDYDYWHYCCDGVNDRGWGCGYRTLQTLCSWVKIQQLQQRQSSCAVSSAQDKDLKTFNTADADRGNIKKNLCGSDTISVIGSGSGDITVIGSGSETDDAGNFEVTSIHNTCEMTGVSQCGFHSEDYDISVIDSGRETDNLEQTKEAVPHFGENERIISGTNKDERSHADSKTCAAAYTENQPHHGIPTQLQTVSDVPSLVEIQKALVSLGDKPGQFVGSRQWIGSYEVCLCLDFFYNVPCKIIHVNQGSDIGHHLSALYTHFCSLGSPVMMGGDCDASSKGIMGVCMDPPALLVVDPHCSKSTMTVKSLQAAGWVKWVSVEDFHQTSFYNLCLPQLAGQT